MTAFWSEPVQSRCQGRISVAAPTKMSFRERFRAYAVGKPAPGGERLPSPKAPPWATLRGMKALLICTAALVLGACEGPTYRGTQPTGTQDETQQNVLPEETFPDERSNPGLGPLSQRSVTAEPVVPPARPTQPGGR